PRDDGGWFHQWDGDDIGGKRQSQPLKEHSPVLAWKIVCRRIVASMPSARRPHPSRFCASLMYTRIAVSHCGMTMCSSGLPVLASKRLSPWPCHRLYTYGPNMAVGIPARTSQCASSSPDVQPIRLSSPVTSW